MVDLLFTRRRPSQALVDTPMRLFQFWRVKSVRASSHGDGQARLISGIAPNQS